MRTNRWKVGWLLAAVATLMGARARADGDAVIAIYRPDAPLAQRLTTVLSTAAVDDRLLAVTMLDRFDIQTLVAGGALSAYPLVTRYKLDGTPDTTFNGVGLTSFAIPGQSPTSVTVTGVGDAGAARLYVGGYWVDSRGPVPFLTRLFGDGKIDPLFAPGSKNFVSPTLSFGTAAVWTDMNIYQADPILTGYLTSATTNQVMVVAYDSLGAIKSTWNGGRPVVKDFLAGTISLPYGSAVDPNGGLAVVGGLEVNGVSRIGVMRLTNTGALDPAFNAGKPLIIDAPNSTAETARSVAFDRTGNLVVTGCLEQAQVQTMFVVRITPKGVIDTQFNSAGAGWNKTVPPGATNSCGVDVSLDAQGNLVVLAEATVGNRTDGYYARYLGLGPQQGKLDNNFDSDGFVSFGFATRQTIPTRLAIGSNGELVAVGTASP